MPPLLFEFLFLNAVSSLLLKRCALSVFILQPRRIAVQLSNDLYRLLTPRLKRRGVTIETEIEVCSASIVFHLLFYVSNQSSLTGLCLSSIAWGRTLC